MAARTTPTNLRQAAKEARLSTWNWHQCVYCTIVCLCQVSFAYPSSIIGITLTQPSFLEYMRLVDAKGDLTNEGASLSGAISGLFQVRESTWRIETLAFLV